MKRRLLTLWNTYAFFVTYARIDDYRAVVRDARRPAPRATRCSRSTAGCWRGRSRWWSECRAALDAYDSPRLVRAVEAQSTICPTGTCGSPAARFWKIADDAGKRAAYDTLWYALVQLMRCVAPVMPFLADELWQNLVRGVCRRRARQRAPGSGYPAVHPTLADDALVAEMDSVRTVVELGRRARDAAPVKLRQPLAEADRRDRRSGAARPGSSATPG